MKNTAKTRVLEGIYAGEAGLAGVSESPEIGNLPQHFVLFGVNSVLFWCV